MNKKKAIGDAVLSIASSAIPLVSLQLVLMPLLARYLPNDNSYGLVVTLLGVTTVISQTFGPLNNIRLMLDYEYKEHQLSGDFNVLVLIFSGVSGLCAIVGTYIYIGTFEVSHIFLIVLVTIINVLVGYFSVAFRLEIDYRKILLSNLMLCLGYFVGFVIFLCTNYWEWIYLIGAMLQLIYVLSNSDLHKEPYRITCLMRGTLYQSLVVMAAGLLASLATYIDRFLLFPLIGGEALSTYHASTILGKAIALGITPIAGVMLSYFSGMRKISAKNMTVIIGLTSLVGAVGYLLCILISPTILQLIYPQWAQEALTLIYVTTLTAVINMICSVISPMILKFRNINWQFFIHGLRIFVYLSVSILLLKRYGLIGFCVGALFASIVQMIAMVLICFRTSGDENLETR